MYLSHIVNYVCLVHLHHLRLVVNVFTPIGLSVATFPHVGSLSQMADCEWSEADHFTEKLLGP